jgi:hypothetical protein
MFAARCRRDLRVQYADHMKNRSLARPGLGPRAWRDLLRLVAESFATGALVSIVLALAVFIVATQAHATVLVSPAASGVLAPTVAGAAATMASFSLAASMLVLARLSLAARRRRHGRANPLTDLERTARAAREIC